MIGFIILGLASCSLLVPGYAQEYREPRPSRTSYARSDDDGVSYAKQEVTTPIPILKQIDKHNDDGSYTYGFEAADGSFKIETKEANGEVRGKYGYTDANGKLHVVEYGANRFGFQPSGEGIEVPPVNLSIEPEEEIEEPAPRDIKPKLSRRPQAQIIQNWEQDLAARAPAQAPAQARAPAAAPHIIYNTAPAVPKRPAFFAGAQPVAQVQPEESYDYEEPAAQARPAQAYKQPAQYSAPAPQRPRPQPIQFAQPQPAARPQQQQYAPAPLYRQDTQLIQAQSRPAPRPAPRPVQFERPAENQQFFRPEPARAQLSRFTDTEAYTQPQAQPQPKAYTAPRPAPKARGGFLDQLEEQFSLPENSANPTHSISFGFY